jgi:hypothetical protein
MLHLNFCGIYVHHVWVSAWLLRFSHPVVMSYVSCKVLVREVAALLSQEQLAGFVVVGFVLGGFLPFLQGDWPGLSVEYFLFDSIF